MTVQYINTGSSPNAGDGDSIRLAFTKINNNFSELNSLIGTTSTYRTINVLNTGTFNDIKTNTLEVFNTATINDLQATGTVSFGLIQGYDDIDIIKYDSDGLNLRLRNTYAESYAAINMIDVQGHSFVIAHQNSDADTSRYLAGQNYIYGTHPDETLNIGRFADINFWADEARYYTPSLETTASITIKKETGNILVNKPILFEGTDTIYIDGKPITITAQNGITVNGNPISGGGTTVTVSTSSPVVTTTGSLWFNSIDGRTYIYYDDQWVDASPSVTPIDLTKVGTDILPLEDLMYDLGSSDKQWKSLWVGTSTIYVGGIPLSINTETNTLTVGTGTSTATNLATESYVIDAIAQASFHITGTLVLPGTENTNIAVVDFFEAAPNNHQVTLYPDWTLKLAARADHANEGHLVLEAGQNTRITVNGNTSNVNITASNGTTAGSWTFSNDGNLEIPLNGDILRNGTSVLKLASGTDTQVQFNNNGILEGHPNFTFNTTTDTLTVPDNIIVNNIFSVDSTVVHVHDDLETFGDFTAQGLYLTDGGSFISINTTTTALTSHGDLQLNPNNNTWTFGADGKLIAPNNILPSTDNAYDLGANGKQWNNLYVNSATIDTGGLTVWGPVTFNGPFNYTGTATVTIANSATFYGDINGFGALYAGVVGYTPTPYTVVQATANINDYAQNNFQNIDNGNTVSTDWVATAANGNDTQNYVDMGITSEYWDGTQVNSLGTALGPNDGYLYVQGGTGGGDLVLGAASTGTSVKILAGQPNQAGIVATFSSNTMTLAVPLQFSDSTIQTTAYTGTIAWNNISGVPNVTGYTGSAGNSGISGYTGSVGNNGISGYTGSVGNNGISGYTGSAGNSGISGYTGSAGAGGVTSLSAGTGTFVSTATGAVTTWIGQSVTTDASPSFAGLTSTGDINANNGNLKTTSLTANLFNTTPTTVNIAGGATVATNIGNAAGTVTISGNLQASTNGFVIGYRDIPQLSLTTSTTLALTDAGKHYYSTILTTPTITIPPSTSTNFTIGTAINIVNQSTGSITIAQGLGVTLYLAGNTTSGARTLGSYGVATLQKVASDTWFIVGVGIT